MIFHFAIGPGYWLAVGMLSKPRLFALCLCLLVGAASLGAAKIAAGPMVGAPEMRAMPLWVQLDGPAEVAFAYWPAGQKDQRQLTDATPAKAADAYVVKHLAGPLDPGTNYQYEVLVDGVAARVSSDLQFTTAPFYTDRAPPPDFTVAVGSGHRVNDAPYDPLNRSPGDGYDIFLAISAKQPAFMLWAGDAVTLREPDWGSRPGMLARYSKNRAQPELQPLLAGTPQVAVVSQGEFGPANTGMHFRNREDAQAAFELFWANPPAANSADALATSVRYGDAEFFLLDDRSHRALEHHVDKHHQILGPDQIEWLRNALRESTATFKVIVTGSSALSPSDSPRNLKLAEDERDNLLEMVKNARIEGLVVIAGGKDFGELTKMVRANAPDLYELSMGPLTDRPVDQTNEVNFYRVPSTGTYERQFALLKFHGPEDNRQLTITMCNRNGDPLWEQTLAAKDMQFQ